MKKTLSILVAVFVMLPLLTLPQISDAGVKGVSDLVGAHNKWTRKLKGDKEFKNKRVLFIVDGERKSTTVDGLLGTVKSVLSRAQYSIFVDPLLLAESQRMGYANIIVSGAVLSSVELAQTPPPDQAGLAALVLNYTGATTLPLQVLANLQTGQ